MAEKETKKTVKKVKETKPKTEKKPARVKKVQEKPRETPKVEKKNQEISMKIIHLRPLVTEKAVMMIEAQNVLTFETSINTTKEQIKREVEEVFEVKVENVRTLIRNGNKYAYVKLNPKDLAIDIATKLGMI